MINDYSAIIALRGILLSARRKADQMKLHVEYELGRRWALDSGDTATAWRYVLWHVAYRRSSQGGGPGAAGHSGPPR